MSDAYRIKLPTGMTLEFQTAEDVFRPTHTSELCIRAAHDFGKKLGKTLDLGCGCGVVGIAAAKMGLTEGQVHASDISSQAVDLARRNAKDHQVAMEVRSGSVFDPWKRETFESILDDISGITEDVARLSPWFSHHIPCESGAEGMDLTARVLEEAPAYLKKGGNLFFPILSLSNVPKILKKARACFRIVEQVGAQDWTLPAEMTPHLDKLREIRSKGRIYFEEKFGLVICSTQVYWCKEPI